MSAIQRMIELASAQGHDVRIVGRKSQGTIKYVVTELDGEPLGRREIVLGFTPESAMSAIHELFPPEK